jgi:hypothetical protein
MNVSAEQNNWDESIYGGGPVSSAKAIINDKTKTFLISVLVALNVVATMAMYVEWKIAERETRLLEYYVMELDGKMMASGLLKPPDSWSGKHKE